MLPGGALESSTAFAADVCALKKQQGWAEVIFSPDVIAEVYNSLLLRPTVSLHSKPLNLTLKILPSEENRVCEVSIIFRVLIRI